MASQMGCLRVPLPVVQVRERCAESRGWTRQKLARDLGDHWHCRPPSKLQVLLLAFATYKLPLAILYLFSRPTLLDLDCGLPVSVLK